MPWPVFSSLRETSTRLVYLTPASRESSAPETTGAGWTAASRGALLVLGPASPCSAHAGRIGGSYSGGGVPGRSARAEHPKAPNPSSLTIRQYFIDQCHPLRPAAARRRQLRTRCPRRRLGPRARRPRAD